MQCPEKASNAFWFTNYVFRSLLEVFVLHRSSKRRAILILSSMLVVLQRWVKKTMGEENMHFTG